MRAFSTAGAVLLPFLATIANGIDFNPDDEASIRSVTRQYAYGLMSLYKNNATGTAPQDIGIWPQPYYWWEGGAAWGGVVEYSQFTGDDSHVKTMQQALTANYGSNKDFILDYRRSQTGNDDQAFWALAVMSAVEYQFPNPDQAPASYLEVAVNAFNNIVSRWDESTCGGGFKWQIYPENNYGYDYKNAISAGCAFALGARLARYTGEQKYADWAVKIYDWTKQVGLISDNYEVYDGSDDKTNCATVADKTQWSYNSAMFLHGSAFMFDYTNGDSTWKDRTSGFLQNAQIFFKPYDNATDIMYETACETGETGRHCNLDQQSFKAYLARCMAKTAIMAPFTKDTITKYLTASAVAAAKSCSGASSTCGSKWYVGGYDGTSGVGQQLSALEVTQALLMLKQGTLPAKANAAPSVRSTYSAINPSSSPVTASAPAPAPSSMATSSSEDVVPISTAAIPPPPPPPSSSSDVTSTGGPGGQFGEIQPAPTVSCTPTTTTTVWVTAVSQTVVPSGPPGVSSSVTTPPLPQFSGPAVQLGVSGCSMVSAMLVALIAGLM